MEKKLSVNNLVISFRTPAGKVQAVRNISFDLNKGETLAIVGESGSGKSVTSKAILGILAGNSIVESGSIIYDGMDLLRISEDEFYHVRGDKIAMIFQDPLSSLNPIMRIGKQLTEAMLLKGKARQKSCRSAFNDTLALLADAMVEAEAAGNSVKAEELRQMCKNFDKFEFKHIELEQAYNEAHEAALEAHDEIKDILFYIEKNAFEDEKYTLKEVARLAGDSFNDWVVNGEEASELKRLIGELNSVSGSEIKSRNYVEVPRVLKEMDKILETAVKKDEPDFFSMGYYITFANEPLPQKSVKELNDFLRKYADEHFIDNFRECAAGALEHNAKKYNELKKEALKVAAEQKSVFEADKLDKKVCLDAAAIMAKAIDASIDKLEIHKDSVAYTFGSTLKILINSYFTGISKNVTAAKKHAKQSAKYEKLVARGKTPSWKVAPSTAVDLDLVQENIVDLIERLENHYKEVLDAADSRNYQNETS